MDARAAQGHEVPAVVPVRGRNEVTNRPHAETTAFQPLASGTQTNPPALRIKSHPASLETSIRRAPCPTGDSDPLVQSPIRPIPKQANDMWRMNTGRGGVFAVGQSGTGWQHFLRCVCATAPAVQ